MAHEFEDAMRGQFDAAQFRLAEDAFADEFGTTVLGRVKRRRALSTAAVGGGTVVAVGAIAVAAMYLPRGASDPASTAPTGCVTWSPSPDPYPVVTVSPDPTDFSFDVTLPDGAGVMTLARSDGSQEGFDVILPDGTTFLAPADSSTGAVVFKIPELDVVAVAIQDFSGNLKVSVGGVDAMVSTGAGNSIPRVVSSATPDPIVDCGTTTGAQAIGSPFQCGFHMDTTYREDPALTITGAGVKSVPEAAAMASDPTLTVTNPVVSNMEPLVPYATAMNNELPGVAAGSDGDPAETKVDSRLGVLTGVAVVKVQDGIVVAVGNEGVGTPGVHTASELVRDDGVTALILDKDYFATCPDATSTAYSQLYAVAGSQTIVRQDANEPPIYVWQQLRGTVG